MTPEADVNLPGTKTFAHDLYSFSTNSTTKTVTYTLTETPYGGIGSSFVDLGTYPFVVFEANSDGTYKCLKGCTQFGGKSGDGGAVDYAKHTTNTSCKRIVYVRKDTETTFPSTNANWSVSTIVIDLGGHTVTPVDYFLPASAKWNTNQSWKNDPVYGQPGYYEIINGEIVLNEYGLFEINAFSAQYNADADDEHYKAMYFKFEGVKITLAEGATLKSITGTYQEKSAITSGNKKMLIDIKYDNCVFDVREAVNTINCFNANDSKYTGLVSGQTYYNTNTIVNITVGSVDVIAGDASVTLYTVNSKNGSWVNFIPGENGKYVTLSLSKNAAAPTTKGNSNTLGFVKTSEGVDTNVYTFAPMSLKAYTPKMSITLDNQLAVNVYIPVESTEKFTFNDGNYENLGTKTVDGKEYYVVRVSLPAASAAVDMKLVATVSVGDSTAKATFTFSIPKYAAKVLNNANASDVEKTLAKDVVAYVKSAYNYFTEFNTPEEIERVNALIESIIGEYEGTPTSSGAVNTVSPVTAVTLNLDEKPTIRFYVTDTSVKFYANGRKLDTVTGTDSNGTYVELDVYAYALCETITYGEGGSYHISNFLAGAVGTSYETLVKCFVKYVESAAAYRESVIASGN